MFKVSASYYAHCHIVYNFPVCFHVLSHKNDKIIVIYGLSVTEHPSVRRLLSHPVYRQKNKTFTSANRTQNYFLTQANIRETERFESSGMLGFLHDKAAVLRQTIKETPRSSRRFEGSWPL